MSSSVPFSPPNRNPCREEDTNQTTAFDGNALPRSSLARNLRSPPPNRLSLHALFARRSRFRPEQGGPVIGQAASPRSLSPNGRAAQSVLPRALSPNGRAAQAAVQQQARGGVMTPVGSGLTEAQANSVLSAQGSAKLDGPPATASHRQTSGVDRAMALVTTTTTTTGAATPSAKATATAAEPSMKALVDENARLRAQIEDLSARNAAHSVDSVPASTPPTSLTSHDALKQEPCPAEETVDPSNAANDPRLPSHIDDEVNIKLRAEVEQLRTRLAEVSRENERLCAAMGDLRVRGVERMRQLKEERDELEERLVSSRDACQALEASLYQLREWSARNIQRKEESSQALRSEYVASQAEVDRLNRLILDLRSRLSERDSVYHPSSASIDLHHSSKPNPSRLSDGDTVGNRMNDIGRPSITDSPFDVQAFGKIKMPNLEGRGRVATQSKESDANGAVKTDRPIKESVDIVDMLDPWGKGAYDVTKCAYSDLPKRIADIFEEADDDSWIAPVSHPRRQKHDTEGNATKQLLHSIFALDAESKKEDEPHRESNVHKPDGDVNHTSTDTRSNRNKSLDWVNVTDTFKTFGIGEEPGSNSSSIGRRRTEKESRQRGATALLEDEDKHSSHEVQAEIGSKEERMKGSKRLSDRSAVVSKVRFDFARQGDLNNHDAKPDDMIPGSDSDSRGHLSWKPRRSLDEKYLVRKNSESKPEKPRRLRSGPDKITSTTTTTFTSSSINKASNNTHPTVSKTKGNRAVTGSTDEKRGRRSDTTELRNPLMNIRREQIIVGHFCQHAVDIVHKLLMGQANATDKEDELKELIEEEWEKWVARLQTKEDLVERVELWVRNCCEQGNDFDVVHSFNAWYEKQYTMYKERTAAGAAIIAASVGSQSGSCAASVGTGFGQFGRLGNNGKNERVLSPVPEILPPSVGRLDRDGKDGDDHGDHGGGCNDNEVEEELDSGAFEDAPAVDDDNNVGDLAK